MDGWTLCYPAFPLVVLLRRSYKDGVNSLSAPARELLVAMAAFQLKGTPAGEAGQDLLEVGQTLVGATRGLACRAWARGACGYCAGAVLGRTVRLMAGG